LSVRVQICVVPHEIWNVCSRSSFPLFAVSTQSPDRLGLRLEHHLLTGIRPIAYTEHFATSSSSNKMEEIFNKRKVVANIRILSGGLFDLDDPTCRPLGPCPQHHQCAIKSPHLPQKQGARLGRVYAMYERTRNPLYRAAVRFLG
jgi:hypothetical protein